MHHVKLLGPIKNISIIMNSIDIHVQSSKSEGFPMLAEAMAHKLCCDQLRYTLYNGKNGWLVKPKNPTKLAIV